MTVEDRYHYLVKLVKYTTGKTTSHWVATLYQDFGGEPIPLTAFKADTRNEALAEARSAVAKPEPSPSDPEWVRL